MAHQTLLTVTCILVLCTTASCSPYDSSASRELARMKKLAEFTHDQLVQENCLHPSFSVGKRNILDTSEDAVRLEMETKLYDYLLDLLIRCRTDKSSTSTPTEKPRTMPAGTLIPSKTPMNIPTHTQMTIVPTFQDKPSPTDMLRPKKLRTPPMEIPTPKELAITQKRMVTPTTRDVQSPNKGTTVPTYAPTPTKMTTTPINVPQETPPRETKTTTRSTCFFPTTTTRDEQTPNDGTTYAPTPTKLTTTPINVPQETPIRGTTTTTQGPCIAPTPSPQTVSTLRQEPQLPTSMTTPEQAKKPIDLSTPSTALLPPTECQNAMSLTESWRLDHIGANIRSNGTSNNDLKMMLQQGNPWFRFVDGAGDVMLNECVPWQSCGTALPIYTPSALPSEVGVIKSIRPYAAHTSCASLYADHGSVMRCSNKANDFVYRYEGKQTGMYIGFCGMVA